MSNTSQVCIYNSCPYNCGCTRKDFHSVSSYAFTNNSIASYADLVAEIRQ